MTAGEVKFKFRLVLLGSHGTGFLFKKFELKCKPTVEDLFTKTFDLGSIEIQVDFLDTSGSMQFPAMRRLSITTGSAFMIVYAVDDEQSYEVLKMCIAEIQEIRRDFQVIPIVFAGNKCDIPREQRKVLKEVVSNYVHYELPRLRSKVIECSCKDNTNIDNLFKAYLSLAQVSLSSAVGVGVGVEAGSYPSPLVRQPTGSEQSRPERYSSCSGGEPGDSREDTRQRRCASMKDALSVRKSCDASILSGGSAARSGSLVGSSGLPGAGRGIAPESSIGGAGQEKQVPSGEKLASDGTTSGRLEADYQVNLVTAIQTKLQLATTITNSKTTAVTMPGGAELSEKLPDEIFQLVDSFKKFAREQKAYRDQKFDVDPILEVEKDTEEFTIAFQEVAVESDRNSQLVQQIKEETTKLLRHSELAYSQLRSHLANNVSSQQHQPFSFLNSTSNNINNNNQSNTQQPPGAPLGQSTTSTSLNQTTQLNSNNGPLQLHHQQPFYLSGNPYNSATASQFSNTSSYQYFSELADQFEARMKAYGEHIKELKMSLASITRMYNVDELFKWLKKQHETLGEIAAKIYMTHERIMEKKHEMDKINNTVHQKTNNVTTSTTFTS